MLATRCALEKIGLKISITVSHRNHIELAPGRNFSPVIKTMAKLLQGEITPRLERVTTYKGFLIDRANFTPGKISPRGKSYE